MTRDPYPMLEKVCRIYTPKKIVGVDLDDPAVWSHPPIEDYRYLSVHWGGGANIAGWPIEEPALTLGQKMAVQLGRIRSVLKGWLAYHKSKGMSTIAYCTWVDILFGRIGRLRGHRFSGGQWGSINGIAHALVLVMGFGQKASRKAWQAVGLVWFCSGGPQVVGHRFFNDWSETQTTTSCPGDENSKIIADEGYIGALGVLRYRPLGLSSKGRCVKAATLKLAELGYQLRPSRNYGKLAQSVVIDFQINHDGLIPDGRVGPSTWKALARA